MIARLLSWMQNHLGFIAVDMYPDFDTRIDRARMESTAAIIRLHGDAEMAEREIRRAREHGQGTDFADDMILGKE